MRLLISLVLLVTSVANECDKDEKTCAKQNARHYTVSGILAELFDVATEYSTDIKDYKILISLLDAIQDQQSHRADYLPRRTSYEEAISALQAFAEERFKLNGVKAVVYPGMGIGIEATKDIKVNEILSDISAAHILDSNQNQLNCLGNLGHKNRRDPASWILLNLTLTVLQHAFGDTEFRPYIDCLPTDFSNPNYFSYDEMDALRGSVVFEASINAVQEMAAMYAETYHALESNQHCANKLGLPLEKFTFKAFQWAHTIAASRSYDGSFLNELERAVIVPFLDLYNHRTDPHIDIYNMPSHSGDGAPGGPAGSYVIYTIAPVKKGQQLFLHYHAPMNVLEAFTNYGFVEYDEITLPFVQSNFTSRQQKFASQFDWIDKKEFRLKDPKGSNRLVNDQILMDIVDIVADKEQPNLSPKLLTKAWAVILAQIGAQMTHYRLTSQQYRNLIRQKVLTANQKLIYNNLAAEIDLLMAM